MNGLQLKGKREEDREILGRRRQNKQWMEEDYLDRNRWSLGCGIRPQRL
jgi:hypothetical protein